MSVAMGVLVDTTKCTGCDKCVDACKKENGLGPDHAWPEQESIDGLSASRWSRIIRRPNHHFVRTQCRHCVDPACASACIVGALKKTPEGPVVYDKNRCIGCRYCMMACPYGIPKCDWDRNTPHIQKCTMCAPRLDEERPPACVEACPEEALFYGTREEVLKEGHRRIESAPGRYKNHVWGENEFGGTSFVYVSDIPLGFLAWNPSTSGEVLPELSWAALKKVPGIVAGVGAFMAGTYWVIGRRMKLASLEADMRERDEDPGEGEA